jgi:LEA14-like dessication related protein
MMIAVFLFVSIIFTLILWVRPPNITIGGVQAMAVSGSTVQVTSSGFNVNLGANISVQNPNFFSVGLKTLKLQLFYPINNTAIGSGQENNIDIRANEQTNFTFPFTLQYTLADDPSHAVLTSLASKCLDNEDLTVNYKITLGLRIIVATISPVISNSFTFACPLTESELSGLISGSGINLRSLSSVGDAF